MSLRIGLSPVVVAAMLAGCSPEAAEPAGRGLGASPQVSSSATTAADDAPSRVIRYTSLKDCPVTRASREEMPFTETICEGPAGWRLRISDYDARQSLEVVAPGGRATRLDTAAIGGGGFSSFGSAAEWRAPPAGEFRPDALIVRYQVAERPYPAPETAYLLAVRLLPVPCVTARIAPGDQQNALAREAADEPGACLSNSAEG